MNKDDGINSTSILSAPKMIISYRGVKVEVSCDDGMRVVDVKNAVAMESSTRTAGDRTPTDGSQIQASDIKLLWKGKALNDDHQMVSELFASSNKNKKQQVYRLVAVGVSRGEIETLQKSMDDGLRRSRVEVRDDITDQGQADTERRRRIGRHMLNQAERNNNNSVSTFSSSQYGFGSIETLPNLPDRKHAEEILTSLANDPGIVSCMKKHRWNVGCLAELYPKGKVGESDVCVMGLNQNKGAKILLRLRTDDLSGFRKPLSIRKVLYHELAHNVHSEHNQDFFQLMRQIEKECTELDWTNGAGLAAAPLRGSTLYEGGSYRLGGGSDGSGTAETGETRRDLAARAAMMRMMSAEEAKEIEQSCGCGDRGSNLREGIFLPPTTTAEQQNHPSDDRKRSGERDDDEMDVS